jgi:hypothetical protein
MEKSMSRLIGHPCLNGSLFANYLTDKIAAGKYSSWETLTISLDAVGASNRDPSKKSSNFL